MLLRNGSWLPWLALPAAYGFNPPPPPQLVLGGECAGVKSSESWSTKEGEPHWSYRIKVAPWTLFGRVHVELHGWGMQASVVRGGDLDVKAKSFWVTLHPKHAAGPDDTFQIEGVGKAFAEPALRCEGLQAQCTLTPLPHTRVHCEPIPCVHHHCVCCRVGGRRRMAALRSSAHCRRNSSSSRT